MHRLQIYYYILDRILTMIYECDLLMAELQGNILYHKVASIRNKLVMLKKQLRFASDSAFDTYELLAKLTIYKRELESITQFMKKLKKQP